MKNYPILFILALLCAPIFALADEGKEIGYVERFALSEDREAALEELIPGTDEFYYYHCLYLEQQGKWDDQLALIRQWEKRNSHHNLRRQIYYRRALLRYGDDPKGSLEYIRKELGLNFNHQRDNLNQKPNLPTSLDQDIISREQFLRHALSRGNNLNEFTETGLDYIMRNPPNLGRERTRDLLRKLQWPDYPNLVDMIVEDIKQHSGSKFGQFQIHNRLTEAQLIELAQKRKEVLRNENYFAARIRRMMPSDDVNWLFDSEAKEDYLTEVWEFVSGLEPMANSLKAHVLYHLLQLQRERGEYDRDLFDTYIKLPRGVDYVEPKYLQKQEFRGFAANLGAAYQNWTLLPPVHNDKELVWDFLATFVEADENPDAYREYIRKTPLEHLWAETMLLAGKGNAETWYTILGPSLVQQIKERVDIDLRPDNPKILGVGDPVELKADLKNVPQLTVKIFEVNTLNFYLKENREIDTAVNLDGLIPNVERKFDYDEAPMLSVRREFEFPELKGKRGVWVVEFVGGGKSSRALIRKGGLQTLATYNAVGHVIKLLDENNQRINEGAIWLGGKSYETNEDGLIVLPFSNNPGPKQLVVESGGFAALSTLTHQNESYQLHAGFFVDREQLLSRNKAMVVIRPSVTVSGVPTGIDVLEDVVLEIQTTTLDGISATDRVEDFELHEDREASHFFSVPDRLATINFSLTAKVDRLSQGDTMNLAASDHLSVNQINSSQHTRAIYLTRFEDNWVVEVLGKNGESIVDVPLTVHFTHQDFKFERRANLETDANGRASLGKLADITRVRVETPTAVARIWELNRERRTWMQSASGKAGEPIVLPYPGFEEEPKVEEIALFTMRRGALRENEFGKVAITNRNLVLTGLEAGDHVLRLRKYGRSIQINVVDGDAKEGYVLGRDRFVQTASLNPMQLVSAKTDDDALLLQLSNANNLTRVHVFGDRFYPEIDAHQKLASFPRLGLGKAQRGKAANSYVSGRTLGEEYRYVLDRRESKRYPGNQLDRAGLILNPWELRSTDTNIDQAAAGDEYDRRSSGQAAGEASPDAIMDSLGQTAASHPDLDFLATGSIALANLKPDENGQIRVPLDDLDDRHWVRIVVTDPTQAITTDVFLEDAETGFQDIRLPSSLDPKKAFAQKKNTTILDEGDTLELSTTEFRIISAPRDIHPILASLTNSEMLSEFAFLLGWNDLEADDKHATYSKYASHEMNFFVARRDPQFFNQVVKPYLANKRDKTFVDDYLLEKNLEEYLQMYEFGRLNIVEKLLLARQLGGDVEPRIERHVLDAFALQLPNPALDDSLFETALRSRSLQGDVAGLIIEEALVPGGEKGQRQLAQLGALALRNEGRISGGMGGGGSFAGRASAANGVAAMEMPAAKPMPSAPQPQPEASKKMMGRKAGARNRDKAKGDWEADDDAFADMDFAEKESESADFGLESADLGFVADAKEMLKVQGGNRELFELGRDGLQLRGAVRQLYRKLDATKVWAENNYYNVPIEHQTDAFIKVNKFWRDYAAWDGEGPFFSPHFTHATGNLSEMIYALALLDLPEEAGDHQIEVEDGVIKITAASPVIVFHQEIEGTDDGDGQLLVSQNFFDPQNRYLEENGQRTDKFVTDEFLRGKSYGCSIVVTNPTSSRQNVDLLTQIPEKSLPLAGARRIHSRKVAVEPFSTQQFEYYFYFPLADGDCAHYPVQIIKDEMRIATTEPFVFNVVDELTNIDKASWDWISQFGTEEQVLKFMNENNLGRLNLERIAWRVKEEAFFDKVIKLLSERGAFNQTLWAYGVHHNRPDAVREFLLAQNGYLDTCGLAIESELVVSNPVQRHRYQHLEYSPLVNARSHRLGAKDKILNDDLWKQYQQFLQTAKYEVALSSEDHMAASYYLLLQDRIEQGLDHFGDVKPDEIAEAIQHDYLTCYAAFYEGDTAKARQIATRYDDYGVKRWRDKFANVIAQIDEIDGAAAEVQDDEDRDQKQDQLADSETTFELEVEDREIRLTYQNLEEVTLNFYEMDLEFLFSSDPFVSSESGRFSMIRPNSTQKVELDEGGEHKLALPAEYRASNVLVEVIAGGRKKSQAYYANSLTVNMVEDYGRLQVAFADDNKPLSATYVKVYARMNDGSVKFYKDGYTDLRGKFDYASLNTNEIEKVKDFAILVSHDKHGSLVKEIAPPNR